MKMHHSITLIAMFLLVCACTQDKGAQPGTDDSDWDEVPVSVPEVESLQQKPAIDEWSEQTRAAQKPDLDLSLPQQALERTDTSVLENPEILPDLFIKKKEKRFRFGGGLLRKEVDEEEEEEEEEDFMNSIDGAEISIETKVN
jgi:hypothetical protein